jgi:hypothetical protein
MPAPGLFKLERAVPCAVQTVVNEETGGPDFGKFYWACNQPPGRARRRPCPSQFGHGREMLRIQARGTCDPPFGAKARRKDFILPI